MITVANIKQGSTLSQKKNKLHQIFQRNGGVAPVGEYNKVFLALSNELIT